MPLYDYHCEKCGKELEVLRRITEHSVPPSADEERALGVQCNHEWKRAIKGTSFVLLGDGWYGRGGY